MARLDLYVHLKLQSSMKLVEGETSIGRDSDCEVQISDGRVSRLHAVITSYEDAHQIENFGANGTKVNGHLLQKPKLLRPGDVIFISDYFLAYQADDTPPESYAATILA